MPDSAGSQYAPAVVATGKRVDKWLQQESVFGRFEEMQRKWSTEQRGPVPRLCDMSLSCSGAPAVLVPIGLKRFRKLRIAEKYAILAGIRDGVCAHGKRVGLWRGQKRGANFARCKAGIPFAVLQASALELGDRHRPALEGILQVVEADLVACGALATTGRSPGVGETPECEPRLKSAAPGRCRRPADKCRGRSTVRSTPCGSSGCLGAAKRHT